MKPDTDVFGDISTSICTWYGRTSTNNRLVYYTLSQWHFPYKI